MEAINFQGLDIINEVLVANKTEQTLWFGKYQGKSIKDIMALGEEGAKYIYWIANKYKQEQYEFRGKWYMPKTTLQEQNLIAEAKEASKAYYTAKKEVENKQMTDLNSDFFGKIGERCDLRLKFLKSRSYSDYMVFTFIDGKNRLFCFYGASNQPDALEQNRFYYVRGTVKAHKEYNQIKSTSLNRVNFLQMKNNNKIGSMPFVEAIPFLLIVCQQNKLNIKDNRHLSIAHKF
jgi:hypothetical protein